jgi:uncharacterized protein HemX
MGYLGTELGTELDSAVKRLRHINKGAIYREVLQMSPQERVAYRKRLLAMYATLPPAKKQQFKALLNRVRRDWDARSTGLGSGASTVATIAQLAVTVGTLYIGYKQYEDEKKFRKEEAKRKKEMLEKQLKAEEKERKRKAALEKQRLAMLEKQLNQEQAQSASSAQAASGITATTGLSSTTLLILGGVGLAGLGAVFLLTGKRR